MNDLGDKAYTVTVHVPYYVEFDESALDQIQSAAANEAYELSQLDQYRLP